MLEQRVEERRIFLQHLAQAGWVVESWDAARDTGARVDLDAEAEYLGPTFALRLELLAEEPYVAFGIHQLDGEPVLRLRLYPGANLASVLAKIIDGQEKLNSDNHPQLVKSLIAICDQLQIETDEGIFNLS